MVTILIIIASILMVWYFLWYVVRELYISHKYKQYLLEQDLKEDDEPILFDVRIVSELPVPCDNTMEKLYVLVEGRDNSQVWATLHHPEKNKYMWCPVADVEFDRNISNLIF